MAGRWCAPTKRLLGAALFSVLWMGTAPAKAAPACPAGPSPADATDAQVDHSPDYGDINRVLFMQDDGQRQQQLRALLRAINKREFTEKAVLVDRLRMALAHTHLRLGDAGAAIAELKSVALDSPQAADALVLLATAVQRQDGNAAATPWIAHAADLFPHAPVTVEGLLLAGGWQTDHAAALPWLTRARDLADAHFAAVAKLQQRAQAPGFLSTLSLDDPDPLVWSLTHTALTDAAFAHAHETEIRARGFRACLQQHLQASRQLREEHPALLSDLGTTLEQLRTLLPAAREALATREADFLQTAQSLRHCRQSGQSCDRLITQRDQQGRELTRLRNSLQTMVQQQRFLAAEQQRLMQRWQHEQEQMTLVGRQLMQQSADNRAIMTALLQTALARSKVTWQDLLARTHFALARAQEGVLAAPPPADTQPSRM